MPDQEKRIMPESPSTQRTASSAAYLDPSRPIAERVQAVRGVRVDGIDFSQAMANALRTKPGGDQLAVTIRNFADVPVPGVCHLIYVVVHSLFNLLIQEDQIRCFENVAAHLTSDRVRRGGFSPIRQPPACVCL
jgi:hypothetical protein